MSDKVELVAAAQVNAFGPDPSGINFNSNFGFDTAVRSSPGVYVLKLEHEHDVKKLVINVTAANADAGSSAQPLSKKSLQISLVDRVEGGPLDSLFFIQVYRVRD
jgi:hypothetical protein